MLIAHRPSAEYHGRPDAGELGTLGWRHTYRGHAGYREFEAEWRSVWETYWVTPWELIDFGDAYLLVGEIAGRGRGSTATVTQPVAILNILDDGGMIVGEYRLADESEAYKTLESLQ